MANNTKTVDVLVIGAGPAALGLMVAAVKKQKFGELIQEDGLAIIDSGISFGGGMLANYGINSNTSANSFLKCMFRRVKDKGVKKSDPTLTFSNSKDVVKQLAAGGKVSLNGGVIQASIKESKEGNQKRARKSTGKERLNSLPQGTVK